MKHQSPNIILIMADQLTPFTIGAYGHPFIKTPAMDKLANEGAVFDSAYTNAPLCAPARFSFMSGQHITRIAAYDNASEFPASIPTFAHYLRQMGYTTCLSGKMHFVGPDQLHGFNERLTTDVYPCDYAWTPDWEMPDERIDKWYHNMDSVKEAGVAATTFQIEYDEEVGFYAQRKIYDYAKAGNKDPFMMVVSFIHPHDPYVALKKYWNLYDEDQIDLPKINIPMQQQDPYSRRVMHGIEADLPGITNDHIKNARHGYYANVSYFDDWVGKIVDTVNNAQLDDNTIIMVTSDHGDMLGERGLWYKMNFFEWSARVPLIIKGPGISQATRIKNNVSLVDIMPTMLDFASTKNNRAATIGQEIDGRSLVPLIKGNTNEDSNLAISEYCAECTGHPVFMIRQDQYKYIHCDADPAMLFDLDNDPDELENLTENPQYQELVLAFQQQVKQRWDSKKIRQDVIATQKSRRSVYQAMQTGEITSWDYQPIRDASNEYVRNHMDWTQAAIKNRFPAYFDEEK